MNSQIIDIISDVTDSTESFEHNPKKLIEPFREIVSKGSHRKVLKKFNKLPARERILINKIVSNTIMSNVSNEFKSVIYMFIINNIKQNKEREPLDMLDDLLLTSQSLDKNTLTTLRFIWGHQDAKGVAPLKKSMK